MYEGVRYFPLCNLQRVMVLRAIDELAFVNDAANKLAPDLRQIFDEPIAPSDADWIEAAKEIWEGSNSDHDVEIQDNAVVSESDSGGAWVQGWLWVANEQNPALPGIPDDEDEDA